MNTSIEALMKAAQSVPVVGEPVAWVNINKHGDITRTVRRRDSWSTTPVFVKPKTYIQAAELATLREKAAMADELRKDAENWRNRHEVSK